MLRLIAMREFTLTQEVVGAQEVVIGRAEDAVYIHQR